MREAEAGVDAAKAVLVKAKDDNERYQKLYGEKSVAQIRAEEATRSYGTAKAEHAAALARLDTSRAELGQVLISEREVEANRQTVGKANETLALAKLGRLQIEEAQVQVKIRQAQVEEAKKSVDTVLTQLQYCRVIAPFDAIVVKRYRSPGDNAPVGSPVVSIYNPRLIYVTANMEEDRLRGIAPGNRAAVARPLRTALHGQGRLGWRGHGSELHPGPTGRQHRRVHQGAAARRGADSP